MSISETGDPQRTADIHAAEHLGESSLIHMHLDDGTVVIARTPGESPTVPGSRITMSAPTSALHVFAESGKALGRGLVRCVHPELRSIIDQSRLIL